MGKVAIDYRMIMPQGAFRPLGVRSDVDIRTRMRFKKKILIVTACALTAKKMMGATVDSEKITRKLTVDRGGEAVSEIALQIPVTLESLLLNQFCVLCHFRDKDGDRDPRRWGRGGLYL